MDAVGCREASADVSKIVLRGSGVVKMVFLAAGSDGTLHKMRLEGVCETGGGGNRREGGGRDKV